MLGSKPMTTLSRRLVLLGALGFGGMAWGQDKKEKKKAGRKGGPLGLLSGTVFHPGGLSLPGAKVTAYATDGGQDKWEGVTDGRGEFALRVPATTEGITYRVRAEAKGMEPQERELTAYEAQRTTANFRLTATD
jgi:Carboxypeptidase regulatory-like domain